jgi:hypothetical protein
MISSRQESVNGVHPPELILPFNLAHNNFASFSGYVSIDGNHTITIIGIKIGKDLPPASILCD